MDGYSNRPISRLLSGILDNTAAHGIQILASLYLLAGLVQGAELLGLWGQFAESSEIAKVWKVYFGFCNLVAGVALWMRGRTAQVVFIFILLTELAVFVLWAQELEYQTATLLFYFLTLVLYFLLLTRRLRHAPA